MHFPKFGLIINFVAQMGKHLVIVAVVLGTLMFVGCSNTPKACEIRGQILAGADGTIEKIGDTRVWVYDATNAQLTANIALPNLGGRTRQDWARIRGNYPGFVLVSSNYHKALRQAIIAETEFRTVNQKFWDKKNALKGRTNGPEFEEVQKLQAETKKASDRRWQAWGERDEQSDLIFYWFNVNPGILYASLPPPLTAGRADTNGSFNFTVPQSKNVLLAAHLKGSINGRPGQYFWLLPVSSMAKVNKVVLNPDNVFCAKSASELKPLEIFDFDSGADDYLPTTPQATPH